MINKLRHNPDILLHVFHQTMLPSVSFSTMRRRLREEKMQMWRKKKRSLLTEDRTAARLEWAKAYEHWTEVEWKTVVWSDEYSVERNKGVSQKWVYRVPADKWKPFVIQSKQCGSRVSVMVWGAFDDYKCSGLKFCEQDPNAARGGVTARTYLKLLQEQLPALYDVEGTIATSTFMHDNTPIHSADAVQEWLQASPYTVMEWLPYSPDLNPIEHCWGPLKENVYRLAPNIVHLTAAEAERRLTEVLPVAWQLISRSHYDKLIKSMPDRVKAVIEAEGWYTRY